MKLKIEINQDGQSRGDIAVWLREIANAVHHGLVPDIRRPIRDFSGREVGFYVIESPIKWPDPMREDEV